ncbi:MAG: TPM domain-containing protein [Paludibacteraceae bacterium]|nr:TPM domain-containing protein [Paludibacteraceae bacterium]
MRKYKYLFFVFCFLVSGGLPAQENSTDSTSLVQSRLYTPATVPSPKVYGQEFYVSDPDGILREDVVANLNQLCHELYRMVEVEMAVVLIGGFDEDKWWAADFCQELFNLWGIGSSERNTGVLLFFSLGTRDIRIHTGYGMEGLLPDAVCDRIIDNNIQFLSDGDYNTGIWRIAVGISGELVTDKAKEELLLGWSPKRYDPDDDLVYHYLYISLIILIWLTVLALYKLRKVEEASFKERPQLIDKSENLQHGVGCLSLFFPLTLPFLYFAYRKQRKSLKDIPFDCPACGTKMTKLSQETFENIGSEPQKTESRLNIFTFDYWQCPSCGQTEPVRYKGKAYSKYKDCKNCGEHAVAYRDCAVKIAPTYDKRGEGQKRFQCEICGDITYVSYSIPSHYEREQERIREQQRREAERHSSYSGGGSRSSGGSWGGGSSGGGGAGRKF